MRGTGANHLFDLRPYPFRILHDFIRPESHYPPTLTFHRRRPPRIGLDLEGVMIAIHFDHELPRDAGEVCEVRADGMLASELRVTDPASSKEFPNFAFGAAAVVTQIACSLGVIVVSGHGPPHLTSPARGRGIGEEECGDCEEERG